MPLEPLCTLVATLKFGEEPNDSHKLFAAFIDTLIGLIVVTAACWLAVNGEVWLEVVLTVGDQRLSAPKSGNICEIWVAKF